MLCTVMILAGIGLEVSANTRPGQRANSTSITRLLFTFQRRAKAGGRPTTVLLRSFTMSIHTPQCLSLWYVCFYVDGLTGVQGEPALCRARFRLLPRVFAGFRRGARAMGITDAPIEETSGIIRGACHTDPFPDNYCSVDRDGSVGALCSTILEYADLFGTEKL